MGLGLSIAYMVGQEIFAGINRKKTAKRVGKAALTTGQNLLTQAGDIETIGGLEELEFREQTAFELSSIESLAGDAGIGLTGSVLDQLLFAKKRFETDALKKRETTRRASKSAIEQADQQLQQARYAKNAEENSFFGFFG